VWELTFHSGSGRRKRISNAGENGFKIRCRADCRRRNDCIPVREITNDYDSWHDVPKPKQMAETHFEILIPPIPRQRKPCSIPSEKKLRAHAILETHFFEV